MFDEARISRIGVNVHILTNKSPLNGFTCKTEYPTGL